MMTDHLKLSRISKALTDRSDGAASFDAAEQRLLAVRAVVVVGLDAAVTPAGQAACLTALNASFKCFGAVTLVSEATTPLACPTPLGHDLHAAARALGAVIASEVTADATHVILIGEASSSCPASFVRCWWDGWISGIVPPWDERAIGSSSVPLVGVFAGALAVREVFATVLDLPRSGTRVSISSLWNPGADPTDEAAQGPDTVYLPPKLWFIGLGHLGQGILWSLGLLHVQGIELVLQDDQKAGVENETTGLLTRGNFVGRRKARVAADWLDRPGWDTRLIERRHYGDIPLLENDPSIVITSLDEPTARIQIAATGFEYLVDAGIGHGPVDFESLQIRILTQEADPHAFWSTQEKEKDLEKLLNNAAYKAHVQESGDCGTRPLATASVAVPFVGAAVGALTLASILRLGSMQTTTKILQMELGTPGMAVRGGENTAPTASRGSLEVRFDRA